MKRIFAVAAGFSLALLSTVGLAAERATPQDAEAFVKRAAAHYEKEGRRALVDFRRYPGPFVDRDMYMVVYDMKGTVQAHMNHKLIGRNISTLYELDGHNWVRERIEAARTHSRGYQDVAMFSPVTKQVEPMRVYWERHGDLIFAAGAYPGITLAQKPGSGPQTP